MEDKELLLNNENESVIDNTDNKEYKEIKEKNFKDMKDINTFYLRGAFNYQKLNFVGIKEKLFVFNILQT